MTFSTGFRTHLFDIFKKHHFKITAMLIFLGIGGVVAATNIVINSASPISLGAGYAAATACDENVTLSAKTAIDPNSGQLYVATIALSDINQNATTGCGQKIMELALKINGQMTYASWGIPPSNSAGTFYFTGATSSLGNYNALSVLTPFQADGLTNIAITQLGSWAYRSISFGYAHACALLSTGAVKCWGYNISGQLGDGTSGTNRLTPVSVSTLGAGVTVISAGGSSTCALLSSGAVKCWGANGDGRLGDGSTTDSNIPVSVSGLNSGVIAISVGGSSTCALLSSGAVKCWGANGDGQLGDGSTTDSNIPGSVSGLSSGVTAISVGGSSACALLSTGAVKCWGLNSFGQLGDGSTTNRLTPVDVSGLSSGVTAISASYLHSCALLSTGAVKCWGANGDGRIGDGTTTGRLTPVSVSGLSSGVTAISVGLFSTCALLSTGAVKCWGDNTLGELGDGTSGTNRLTPVDVLGLP